MALNLTEQSLQSLQTTRNSPQIVKHESSHAEIPDDFLQGPSALPVTLTHVPFTSSPVPEYDGCFALVLDNVISRDECQELIKLAEQSATPANSDAEGFCPWRSAMVSLGPGVEASAKGYRESDRIVWDEQEITDRIWARCCQAEGLQDQLARVEEGGDSRVGRPSRKWEFRRINARMRFLRYSVGNFFKAHTDGPFWYEDGEREFQTHYTVHLYLNDSVEASPDSELVGGATAFLSRDRQRRVDVNPKAGSALVFQHSKLLHEGSVVQAGQKFTVRMDLLYEWVNKSEKAEVKKKTPVRKHVVEKDASSDSVAKKEDAK
uniref:Prolyl 4-hydroxylase alpha subunit domain-containing protein n=1 Tax=Bionectria ochroleuca TaxID=29856 RepID=A0A8H7K5W4_BIOOC